VLLGTPPHLMRTHTDTLLMCVSLLLLVVWRRVVSIGVTARADARFSFALYRSCHILTFGAWYLDRWLRQWGLAACVDMC
jgi:hypothetical protein